MKQSHEASTDQPQYQLRFRRHRARTAGPVVLAWLLHSHALLAEEAPSSARDAHSTPRGGAEPATPEMESRWYGWQTLATDGAALGLFTGGIALDVASDESPGLLAGSVIGLGVTTYLLGGPVVHFAQGNPGRAAGSFALRLGAPLVLGYGAVAVLCENGNEFCGLVAIPGGLLGIATAIAVDSAALARHQVPVQRSGFTVVPAFRADRRAALLGLSGTF